MCVCGWIVVAAVFAIDKLFGGSRKLLPRFRNRKSSLLFWDDALVSRGAFRALGTQEASYRPRALTAEPGIVLVHATCHAVAIAYCTHPSRYIRMLFLHRCQSSKPRVIAPRSPTPSANLTDPRSAVLSPTGPIVAHTPP
ncbi:hypothetical protein P171DRAFT_88753 [Karstenula rhodostoma CBS 690.94]|uniref:Uncharacterized protein n=1 Tax=Karstenula rhodostoma CBS 690.94 TaxID=1392251 RepID=A0A9P4PCY9_9PLEO|nr:hypothetical protein P171DRAFT_88753 [Karstenula rhodostoma CBS 690.94]